MRNTIAVGLISLGLGWSSAAADVSEMIFYPEPDFAEGIFHFNYQGEKNKNYGFMFEKGFDPERIVYVRPAEHRIEKLRDGSLKVSFSNTDRYSYLQRAYRDDFLVSDEKGIVKILLSGGDCKSSSDCVTAENILTVNIPKGYGVRSYQGLDQDLKPLKNPQWQRKGNTYTLTARDVKGACIMMELERLKPGQAPTHPAMASAAAIKPAAKPAVKNEAPLAAPIKGPSEGDLNVAEVETPAHAPQVPREPEPEVRPVAVAAPKVQEPKPKSAPEAPKAEEKPVVRNDAPAAYFRNFQLFENRSVVALNEEGKARLNEWVRQFRAGGYQSVIINAYTDSIPPQRLKHLYATNEILSAARGKVVADYLIAQGIDASRVSVNGKGALDPVASNDTEEGRSKNRRIEFVLR